MLTIPPSPAIQGKSFLVTGGAGFIGSHIVSYLLENNPAKVRVLDNLSTGFESNLKPFKLHPAFEFMKGDICSPDDCERAVQGIDYISHQAALGSVPRSIENPLATHQVNATGFINVLIAAKNNGIKRVVFASSSSVYGDLTDSPKVESRIGSPLSPYAVSKLVNEQYGAIFSKVYGMEIIGLRYFNIFGPRQNPNGPYAAAIPLFISSLMENKPVYINGDGEQSRDFTYVLNAVSANIKALLSAPKEACNKVYNVACGDSFSVNYMFEAIRTLLNVQQSAIHRAERFGDVRNSKASIEAAKEAFQYEVLVSFENGLKETVQWFQKA